VLYLLSPGTGDVASQPVLALGAEAPPAVSPVPNYDTDRDNDTGLLLKQNSGSESVQSFRWEVAGSLHVRGAVTVELHATARNQSGPFALDVRLRICRGAACTEIGYGRASAESPDDGYGVLEFDLGAIDVALLPGDAVELVIEVPFDSPHHVWLAYDTAATPSRFTFEP
jgi:hypothetical protein